MVNTAIIPGGSSGVQSYEISDNERYLYIAGYETLYQFDLQAGRTTDMIGLDDPVVAMAVSPTGRFVVLATSYYGAYCYDMVTGETRDFPYTLDNVSSVIFSPKGEYVYFSMNDRAYLAEYEIENLTLVKQIPYSGPEVINISFSTVVDLHQYTYILFLKEITGVKATRTT